MNRRSVLKSLGATTIAGSAVLGSGALTQVTAQRNVSIDVATDSNAAVALDASSTAADGAFATIEQGGTNSQDNGQLTFTTGDLNSDSQLQVGDAPDSIDLSSDTISDYAFTIGDNRASSDKTTSSAMAITVDVQKGDSADSSGLGLAFLPTGSAGADDLASSNTTNWTTAEPIAADGLKNSGRSGVDSNLPSLPERYQKSDNSAKSTNATFLLDSVYTVGAELLIQADDDDNGTSPNFDITITAETIDASA